MATSLKRRLEMIEAAVLPKPGPECRLLPEPKAGAPIEAWETHRKALSMAKATSCRVMIVRYVDPPRWPIVEDGAEVFGSELEAQLAVLAGLPSEQGNRDRLADVLQGLSGRVIGVASSG